MSNFGRHYVGTYDVECDCGERMALDAEEIIQFAITICPNCEMEVCLEGVYDEVNMDNMDIGEDHYGINY